MTALPSIHASKMQFIDPQKLTLFAYPPHPASLTLRRLPLKGEGKYQRLLPEETAWYAEDDARVVARSSSVT